MCVENAREHRAQAIKQNLNSKEAEHERSGIHAAAIARKERLRPNKAGSKHGAQQRDTAQQQKQNTKQVADILVRCLATLLAPHTHIHWQKRRNEHAAHHELVEHIGQVVGNLIGGREQRHADGGRHGPRADKPGDARHDGQYGHEASRTTNRGVVRRTHIVYVVLRVLMNLILWRQIVHDGKGAGHRKGIVNQNGVISRCGVIAVRHVVTGYGIIIEYGMVAKHRVNFIGGDGSGRKRQRVPVVITVDGHALDGIGRTKRRPFVIRKKRFAIIMSRGLGGTSGRSALRRALSLGCHQKHRCLIGTRHTRSLGGDRLHAGARLSGGQKDSRLIGTSRRKNRTGKRRAGTGGTQVHGRLARVSGSGPSVSNLVIERSGLGRGRLRSRPFCKVSSAL